MKPETIFQQVQHCTFRFTSVAPFVRPSADYLDVRLDLQLAVCCRPQSCLRILTTGVELAVRMTRTEDRSAMQLTAFTGFVAVYRPL
ncbi:hypothetical protein A4R29_32265 (plasmid) [Mesorhizobium ciceri biovar biserrulae]|nr:hypothetical protein A4R29_32265 [Mesorhizobium ciceri biovar biserrulae]